MVRCQEAGNTAGEFHQLMEGVIYRVLITHDTPSTMQVHLT